MKHTVARNGFIVYTILFLGLLMAGCALSPQTVNINPAIEVQGGIVQSQSVSVEVVDRRDSHILGQRGGVYGDTSHISTGDNLTTTLRNSLVRAMQEQGYTVVEGNADTRLTVEVNSMTYSAYKEKLLYRIEIAMAVRAIANKNGKEYTGDYKTNRKKDYVKLPSNSENEEIINETFAGVLKSMLSDDELIGFIRQ